MRPEFMIDYRRKPESSIRKEISKIKMHVFPRSKKGRTHAFASQMAQEAKSTLHLAPSSSYKSSVPH